MNRGPRERHPAKMAFEQIPGGGQGVIRTNITEKDILAEGPASVQALGRNMLVLASQQVRVSSRTLIPDPVGPRRPP